MPTVVYKKPSAFEAAIRAGTGLIEGKSGAEMEVRKRKLEDQAFDEDALRYRVDTANEQSQFDRQLSEGQRQFNVDDQFRRSHLQYLKDEGLLGRAHETKIQNIRDTAEMARLQESLATSRRNVDEQEKSDRYRTKKTAEAQQTQLALERAVRLQDDKSKLDFGQQVIGKYGDPAASPYTKEQWEAIYQEAYDRFLGPGTTTGQQDVVQATEAQKEAIRRQVTGTVLGYNQAKDKLISDTVDNATALQEIDTTAKKYLMGVDTDNQKELQANDAALRSDPKRGVGVDGGIGFDEIFSTDPNAKDPYGQQLLTPQFYRQLTVDQIDATQNAEAYIADISTRFSYLDPLARQEFADAAEQRVERMLSTDSFRSLHPTTRETLVEYYKTKVGMALYQSLEAAAVEGE